MQADRYVVSTTMGDTVLTPNASTYVKISNRDFLEKSIPDLKPGDLVLFEKPFATTEVEDVDPFLTKSPRYAKAKEILHEVNSRGEYIPFLRCSLLRGLAKRGIINYADLETRIMKEGSDFTDSDYRAMTEYVHRHLAADERTERSKATIRKWLEGDIVAPRAKDWYLIGDVLSTSVDPEFSMLQHDLDDPVGLYFNYRLYVTIRQGVMRFLREARGIASQEENVQGENRISLSPEYQIVFNHFMQELTANYALARVTEVKGIEKKQYEDMRGQKGWQVEHGVAVSGKEVRLPTKSHQEVAQDMYILGEYLSASIEQFRDLDRVESIKVGEKLLEPRQVRQAFSREALAYMLEYFGEPLDPAIAWYKRLQKVDPELDKTLGGIVMNPLLSGEMDYFFRFSRGTIMRLLESYFRTRTAIPNRVYEIFVEYANIFSMDHPNQTKNLKIWRNKKSKIELKYQIKLDEGLLPEFLTDVFFPIYDPREFDPDNWVSMLEYLESIKDDREKFLQIVRGSEGRLKKGQKFLTKKETFNCLERFELPDIIDLRKQSFYHTRFNLISSRESMPPIRPFRG